MSHLNKILNLFSNSSHDLYDQIIHGVTWSFLFKILALMIGFFSNILLARILGSSEFGVYSYVITITELLIVLSILGLPLVIVREVAKSMVNKDWSVFLGLKRKSLMIVWSVSLAISFITAITAILFQTESNYTIIYTLLILLPLVVTGAVMQIHSGMFQGMKYIIHSQIPSLIIQRATFIIFVLTLFLVSREHLTLYFIASLQVGTAILALIYSTIVLNKIVPKELYTAEPRYDTKLWLKSAFVFLLIHASYLISAKTDILMIGALMKNSDVGIYRAAVQGADLVALTLVVANLVLQPNVSRLFESGNYINLQKMITKVARSVAFAALPIALSLAFFGEYFMKLFGMGFINGSTTLTILVLGRYINVCFGLAGVILSMTGHEFDAFIGIFIGAILNIVLNLILIPKYGIDGAALATMISMSIWTFILVVMAKFRTGIDTTVFGLMQYKS